MSELSDYDIRQIENSIENINRIFSEIENSVSRNRFDFRELQRQINDYLQDAKDAEQYTKKSIDSLTNGKGIFFRQEDLNDVINNNFKSLNEKVNKLSDDYNKKIKDLLDKVDNIEKTDFSFDFNNSFDSDESFDFKGNNDFIFDNQEEIIAKTTSESNIEEATQNKSDSVNTNLSVKLVSNLDEILSNNEETEKPSSNKKIIIRKNTPLDSDEIKELFISRNLKYNINLSQLNEGITFAGNNVDKNNILLGAMYAKYRDDLKTNNYFDVLWDIKLIVEFLHDSNKDECLEFLFGKFYLITSGYSMAHENYCVRENFNGLVIDPRICTRDIVDINSSLGLSELELMMRFEKSKYVIEISQKLKDPFYDIKTSSKLMIMSYKHPDDFIKCNELGFQRIN